MIVKPGEIKVAWSKQVNDIAFLLNGGDTGVDDAHFLYAVFKHGIPDNEGLMKALDERGYDLKTLRFTIKRKVETLLPKEGE